MLGKTAKEELSKHIKGVPVVESQTVVEELPVAIRRRSRKISTRAVEGPEVIYFKKEDERQPPPTKAVIEEFESVTVEGITTC